MGTVTSITPYIKRRDSLPENRLFRNRGPAKIIELDKFGAKKEKQEAATERAKTLLTQGEPDTKEQIRRVGSSMGFWLNMQFWCEMNNPQFGPPEHQPDYFEHLPDKVRSEINQRIINGPTKPE